MTSLHELLKDEYCAEQYYAYIQNKIKDRQRENRMRSINRVIIHPRIKKPVPFHLKKVFTEKDEDTVKVWYRKKWREGGFKLIDEIKEEDKRYRGLRSAEWESEFGNLSEEELDYKQRLWFAINWVDSNTDWRRCPHNIVSYQSLEELEIERQAIERGYWDF